MTVFRLTMLPAREGDCLILTYGPAEDDVRHIVIDGGRKATWPALKAALEVIAGRSESVELLLLSHIDADHIDGLLEFANADPPPIVPKAIWYNGFDQIKPFIHAGGIGPSGFPVADAYTNALADKGWPLNLEFGGKAISVNDQPKTFTFAGLDLTLLSPSRAKLSKLAKEWEKWRNTRPAGFQPRAKRSMPATLDVDKLSLASSLDGTAPNGSSIALIAEYGGRRVLLGADAHPDIMLTSLTANAGANGNCAFDLVKLPHHGSRANLTRGMIEKIDCERFAISTSGAVFGHPDPEAISRLLKFGPARKKTLYFNYASERTLPWDKAALRQKWNYECVFPAAVDTPLVIDI